MRPSSVVAMGKRLAPSVLDQLTYGLATFVVTAAALRSSEAEAFGRFSLVWGFAWTGVALLSELLVTPARLELTGKDAVAEQRAELVERALRLIGVILLPASLVAAYLHLSAEPVLSVLCISVCGVAFLLRRSMAYASQRPWAAARLSLLNLAVTVLLLAATSFSGGAITSFGRVLAAAALLVPLFLVSARSPAGDVEAQAAPMSVVGALGHYSRSGRWFAVAVAVRTLAYTTGLLSLVSATRGFAATATLAATFILAAPVQVLAAALPLTLFPRLVAVKKVPARLKGEVVRQFQAYVAAAIVSAVGMVVFFGPWSRLLGERAAATTSVVAVALLITGLILTSFSGSVVLLLASPRTNLLMTAVTALATLLLAVSVIPVEYLPPVPYGILLLCHVVVIVPMLRRRDREPVHA